MLACESDDTYYFFPSNRSIFHSFSQRGACGDYSAASDFVRIQITYLDAPV